MRKEIDLLKKQNAQLAAKIRALEEGAPDNSRPESNMEDLEDTVSECSGSTSVSRPQTRTTASTLADHERRLTNIETQLQVITEQLAQIPVMIQQGNLGDIEASLQQAASAVDSYASACGLQCAPAKSELAHIKANQKDKTRISLRVRGTHSRGRGNQNPRTVHSQSPQN
ncbi:hypothetical protein HPB50_002738 [Hyalomma asiaticum]|uniref:Uncharacterized protein n=1 Tax=Hyalomma asiaticum TaxID=266040 RepID=A0ACB7SBH9_HYAAI|nr:hypothetical protein HPB50_002738 [Hyalomma asiaticum]